MIKTDISHFSGAYSHLNNIDKLRVSTLKLALAAMTAGRSSPFNVQAISIPRMIHLLSAIISSVKTNSGMLCIKPAYYRLETTEQAAISFILGNAVTKVCAEKLLNCPWLTHLKDKQGVQLTGSGVVAPSKINLYNTPKIPERPDFIGTDMSGAYHVFESKGSCSSYNKSEMQHAINQVSQVITINGTSPVTRVACYAEGSASEIIAHIIDPEASEDGFNVQLNKNEMIKYYYRFIGFQIWEDSTTVEIKRLKYKVLPFRGSNIYFGVLSDLFESIRENPSFDRVNHLLLELELREDDDNDSVAIGLDGTILIRK